jgi:cobalt-zinc-cadmium efflux system protein
MQDHHNHSDGHLHDHGHTHHNEVTEGNKKGLTIALLDRKSVV